MTTSAAGRLGTAGIGTEVVRVFNRALELVNSSAGGSDKELLDMVKRAKREMDKEPFHHPKKARSGRASAPAEAGGLESLGHSNRTSAAAQAASVVAPAAPEHTASPPAGGPPRSDGGSGATSAAAAVAAAGAGGGDSFSAAGGGSITHDQARSINVIRGGPGRGRIEKPKRKVAR